MITPVALTPGWQEDGTRDWIRSHISGVMPTVPRGATCEAHCFGVSCTIEVLTSCPYDPRAELGAEVWILAAALADVGPGVVLAVVPLEGHPAVVAADPRRRGVPAALRRRDVDWLLATMAKARVRCTSAASATAAGGRLRRAARR
eukprot:9503815-Pyramimonas_sp.AAC.2